MSADVLERWPEIRELAKNRRAHMARADLVVIYDDQWEPMAMIYDGCRAAVRLRPMGLFGSSWREIDSGRSFSIPRGLELGFPEFRSRSK
jgi:hypothetical protein